MVDKVDGRLQYIYVCSEMGFHLLNPEIIAVSRLTPPLCSKKIHRSSHLRDSQLFKSILSFCASVSTLSTLSTRLSRLT